MISNPVLEKLEFNKVLGYIAKYAQTEGGKNSCIIHTAI
jgi:dsDNA-specific endonuclease/ATPase MutS2